MKPDEIVRRYQKALAPAFEQAARILRDDIRDVITASAAPSGPGMPPSSSGPYENSWQATSATIKDDTVSAAAFSAAEASNAHVPLAILLEFGTRTMAPRPHIRPGIARAAPKIQALFRSMLGGRR